MKNIVKQTRTNIVFKNYKQHSLYYPGYRHEGKWNSKRDKFWYDDKTHHSYKRNYYGSYWFNNVKI